MSLGEWWIRFGPLDDPGAALASGDAGKLGDPGAPDPVDRVEQLVLGEGDPIERRLAGDASAGRAAGAQEPHQRVLEADGRLLPRM